jgi:signal transduction histidine kinase
MAAAAGERLVRRTTEALAATSAEELSFESSMALLAIGEEGAILSRDPRFAALFGVPAEIAESGSMARLVAWLAKDGDDVCAALRDVLLSDEAAGDITSSDGRVIEWSATRMGRSGRLLSFRTIAHYRAAMRALHDAETWLRMFATHTGGVVLELDAEGRLIGTWSADSTILGMPESAFQGRSLAEAIGPAHAAELIDHVKQVLATRRARSFEYVLEVGDDRRVFAVDATLLGEDPVDASVVTVLIRDITEQTRIQTQLVQAERLASVGLLAAGVAHEINNPLTYMLLNLRRVRRSIQDLGDSRLAKGAAKIIGDVEQCIDMTVEGAQRVQEIVQDLRRFSRSDHEEPRVPVDVRRILAFTLDMTDLEIRRHARVVRDFREVPLVLGSDGRLSQVFLNLVLNAVQAIPEGNPEQHEIRLVTSTDARGYAVIEIRDTGVGIPAARVRKIFDPFFTTKPSGIGTGLGLAICHGIAKSLDGEITVESTVGSGSVFRVILPPTSKEREATG